MGRRLSSHIHVYNDEGVAEEFFPGDDVPAWARDRISNPDVWEDEIAEEIQPQDPPRAGRGSGRDEWVAFAESHGVTVDDDDSRDDVIAALGERGVIEG